MLRHVDSSGGGDFACDHADAGRDKHFAGHAARGVLRENRVKNGVGNMVGYFIGMAFGHRFGREQVFMFVNFGTCILRC